jgi:hypothetical protein
MVIRILTTPNNHPNKIEIIKPEVIPLRPTI